MAHTFHHGAKRDIKAPRNPEGYVGYAFCGCWMQEGRAFVKRTEHRMVRRHGKKVVRQELVAMQEVAPVDTRSRSSKYNSKVTMDMLYNIMHGYAA